MELTIETLLPERGQLRAACSCTLGRANGVWHGEDLPVPFQMQVEIDIDDHDAITRTGFAPAFRISCSGNINRVVCQVESTGDGMLCVRLGNDVFQLETLQSDQFKRGDWIRIETTALHLYPVSV